MKKLPPNIVFKTSTIADGNMSFRFDAQDDVVKNREGFLKKHKLQYKNCVCMRCNHGSKITAINRSNFAANLGAKTLESMLQSEVLVTNEPGTILMLLTADCLPVAFYDPTNNVIALAHLNRRTIARNLGQRTVRYLYKHYGSVPSELIIAVGPHIKQSSYRFAPPLTEPTPKQLLSYINTQIGQISIDLLGAEIAQLTQVGVMKTKIHASSIDTAISPKCFSHYRSQRDLSHPEGRMATILSITR